MSAKVLATSMRMFACGAPHAGVTTETGQRGDSQERDEFNQAYQLVRGARVEVSSLSGNIRLTRS